MLRLKFYAYCVVQNLKNAFYCKLNKFLLWKIINNSLKQLVTKLGIVTAFWLTN